MARLGVVVALLAVLAVAVQADIINTEVTRNIDITTQVVHVTTAVQIENTGPAPVSQVTILLSQNEVKHLSFVLVHSAEGGVLKIAAGAESGSYVVTLEKEVAAKGDATIIIDVALTNALVLYPAAITQEENQKVRYHGNHFFLSPYATKRQRLSVRLSSKNIESYSRLEPVAVKDNVITYGPYSDVPANSFEELVIHSENNSPFVKFLTASREIEVSHWGTVQMEETVQSEHQGAKLKGQFSRVDFQRNPQRSAPSSVQYMHAVIPAESYELYYRDDIGNISSSVVQFSPSQVDFTILPRFPLFGGWKTDFYVGWYLPFSAVVKSENGRYVLNATFSHSFQNIATDDFTLRVVLPKGASDIKWTLPFEAATSESTDAIGRPVAVATKKNLVDNHKQFFQVSYTFSSFHLLQEPIILFVLYAALFVAALTYLKNFLSKL